MNKFGSICAALCVSATLFGAAIDTTSLTPEQQLAFEELLERKIEIESSSHLGRIVILEEAEDCIRAATTLEAFAVCERTEAQAREELRNSLKDEHEELRADFRELLKEIRQN